MDMFEFLLLAAEKEELTPLTSILLGLLLLGVGVLACGGGLHTFMWGRYTFTPTARQKIGGKLLGMDTSEREITGTSARIQGALVVMISLFVIPFGAILIFAGLGF